MFEVKHKWDYAWKEFLSSDTPWCGYILSKLLGEEYRDFFVDLSKFNKSVKNLNTEFRDLGKTTYADVLLSFDVDKLTKRVHIELQSYDTKDIALRTLKYALNSVTFKRCRDNLEEVFLPDSFIVNVRNNYNLSRCNTRILKLMFNGKSVSLEYPVIEAYLRVPEISNIMSSRDNNELLKKYRQF